MAETKIARRKTTVKLATPVVAHEKVVSEIELREPTGGEYVRLGDPRVLVRSQTGSGYFVEQNDVIAQYVEKCMVAPADAGVAAAVRELLSLEDMMAVKMAILDFFLVATAKVSARGSTP